MAVFSYVLTVQIVLDCQSIGWSLLEGLIAEDRYNCIAFIEAGDETGKGDYELY